MPLILYRKGGELVKNIIISILGLAVAIGLIFGAIIPIAARGRLSASNAIGRIEKVEDKIVDELSEPVWP